MIRRARPSDVERMVELVHGLAEYQHVSDDCTLTAEQLHERLFGPSPAVFAHVAELDGEVVGTAIWFLNFSTWTGHHGIFLLDLYVQEQHRGSGLGKALLTELAEECVRNDYTQLEWVVLNWNTPSIGFYRALGAHPEDGQTTFRLAGEALHTLGTSEN